MSSENYSKEVDWNLWDRFLKYDLCITDYESLTDDEKELCRFIFETEQSSDETIICERARRTLAHDENIGERIALDQLDSAYGIWDNYSATKPAAGYQSYIHCVPDIKHLDGTGSYNEYWTDDGGSVKVHFIGENSGQWTAFKIYGEDNYEIGAVPMPEFSSQTIDGDDYYVSDEFINADGDYYYIRPDNTAVLVKSRYSTYQLNTKAEPITDTVIIPAEINGCPVTAIEHEAFMNASVTEVILPDTIQFIDENAFGNCQYLEEISLPENLKYMGMYAFAGSGITKIEIDCPNAQISPFAFSWCYDLTEAYINAGVIGENAFTNCRNLSNVVLGDNVERICADAFYNCEINGNLTLPSSLKIIGCGAFAGSTEFGFRGIKSVTIPPTVGIIGALPAQRGAAPTSGIDIPATHPLTDEQPCVFDSDCIINGWYDTEAHSYALENDLKFNALDELEYGDINKDGSKNIADAVVLQNYLLRGNTVGYEADLNKDGRIDVFDMIAMRNSLVISK